MKNTAKPDFRPLIPEDQDFLFAMLFEAIFVPPGAPALDMSILELPEIRKYVSSWGKRQGDRGIVLILEGKPAGAIWLRFFRKEEQGYGYVADDIPELSMALLPEFRGRGYGTELLRKLLEDLPADIHGVSLSVDPANSAIHLYKKFGFKKCGVWGTSITMRFNRNSKVKMEYELIRTDGTHPGFLALIKELDKELRSYESDHDDVYITQNIVPENVYVTLIMQDDNALACACLRTCEEQDIELKRMYVLPEHRGKGFSRQILNDLEKWAVELGSERIILETGDLLKEAIALYSSSGYERINNYGQYRDIKESICFAKKLRDGVKKRGEVS